MNDSVIVESNNGIAVVYLNEPNSLNALSMRLKEQMQDVLDALIKDVSIKVVIFTGKGRAFCAGGDVKAMADLEYDPIAIKKMMDASARLVETIRNMPKITLAAVHGYAAGAGMSLALSTDLILAEKETKFVLSFKNVGLVPDLGLHYHLTRIVGEWKAKEWIFKGAKITAEEAHQYGFVIEVTEKGTVLEQTFHLAQELVQGPTDAFLLSKQLIANTANGSFESVLKMENDQQTILRGTEYHKKALEAFFSRKQ